MDPVYTVVKGRYHTYCAPNLGQAQDIDICRNWRAVLLSRPNFVIELETRRSTFVGRVAPMRTVAASSLRRCVARPFRQAPAANIEIRRLQRSSACVMNRLRVVIRPLCGRAQALVIEPSRALARALDLSRNLRSPPLHRQPSPACEAAAAAAAARRRAAGAARGGRLRLGLGSLAALASPAARPRGWRDAGGDGAGRRQVGHRLGSRARGTGSMTRGGGGGTSSGGRSARASCACAERARGSEPARPAIDTRRRSA